ncbi:hypothetical protein D9M71_359090 [compost metagenome]
MAARQTCEQVLPANLQQLAIQVQPWVVLVRLLEIRTRGGEGLWLIGVGNPCAFLRVGEGLETGELGAAAIAHGLRQLAMVAGEKQERFARGPFITHEQQGNHGREQQQGGRGAQGLRRAQLAQALTQGAVADLVMVLQKQNERRRRQVRAGFSSWHAPGVGLPLVDEALAQAACQLLDGAVLEVLVVTLALTGQEYVQDIVAIVVPLPVESLFQQVCLIVFVLQDQPDLSIRFDSLTYPVCQVRAKGRVGNGVHGVQAQAVEPIVQQPHQGIVDKEVSDLRPLEIDGGAPGRVLVLAKKAFCVTAQVVAVRAEVVVHHVEHDHEPQVVGTVDQAFQLLRGAIAGLWCVGLHAVVAPVAFTGKLRDWHQLDGRDTQCRQAR